jgi:hypothetical protein
MNFRGYGGSGSRAQKQKKVQTRPIYLDRNSFYSEWLVDSFAVISFNSKVTPLGRKTLVPFLIHQADTFQQIPEA